MELLTVSGKKLLVTNGERGKLLAFDGPVATVELTDEEALRLAYALGKQKQAKLTQSLRQLGDSGFLKEPRTFSDIKGRLESSGIVVKSSSLHVLLNNLVERKEVSRKGSKGAYAYSIAPAIVG
jgi:hypothetical protein